MLGGLVPIVMFLFGAAVGYIVRDARADAQVIRMVADARRESQQSAEQAVAQVERAAKTMGGGLKVAAESTKAAVDKVASKEPPAADKGQSTPAPQQKVSVRNKSTNPPKQ